MFPKNFVVLIVALASTALALPSTYTIGEPSSFSGGSCQVYNDGNGRYSSLTKCVSLKASGGFGIGSCCWRNPLVGDREAHTYTG